MKYVRRSFTHDTNSEAMILPKNNENKTSQWIHKKNQHRKSCNSWAISKLYWKIYSSGFKCRWCDEELHKIILPCYRPGLKMYIQNYSIRKSRTEEKETRGEMRIKVRKIGQELIVQYKFPSFKTWFGHSLRRSTSLTFLISSMINLFDAINLTSALNISSPLCFHQPRSQRF